MQTPITRDLARSKFLTDFARELIADHHWTEEEAVAAALRGFEAEAMDQWDSVAKMFVSQATIEEIAILEAYAADCDAGR